MIKKIVWSSILPYVEVAKKVEGKSVVECPKVHDGCCAEKIYRENLDNLVRDTLGLHDRTPNFSFTGTSMHHSYSIDGYLLLKSDGTAIQSVVSSLTTQQQTNLEVRKHYLEGKDSEMSPHDKDMVAGTLQLLVAYKGPNRPLKRLCDILSSLQDKGEGVYSVDQKDLVVRSVFLDKDELELLVPRYLALRSLS